MALQTAISRSLFPWVHGVHATPASLLHDARCCSRTLYPSSEPSRRCSEVAKRSSHRFGRRFVALALKRLLLLQNLGGNRDGGLDAGCQRAIFEQLSANGNGIADCNLRDICGAAGKFGKGVRGRRTQGDDAKLGNSRVAEKWRQRAAAQRDLGIRDKRNLR